MHRKHARAILVGQFDTLRRLYSPQHIDNVRYIVASSVVFPRCLPRFIVLIKIKLIAFLSKRYVEKRERKVDGPIRGQQCI